MMRRWFRANCDVFLNSHWCVGLFVSYDTEGWTWYKEEGERPEITLEFTFGWKGLNVWIGLPRPRA